MEVLFILIAVGILIFSFFLIYKAKKIEIEFEKKEKNIYNNIIENKKEEIYRDVSKIREKLEKELADFKRKEEEEKRIVQETTKRDIEFQKQLLKQCEDAVKEVEKNRNLTIKKEKEVINAEVAAHREKEFLIVKKQIEDFYAEQRSAALKSLSDLEEENQEKRIDMENKISVIKEELSEFQKKRDAINAEIIRQKEIEENTDFYRVCISDRDIEDISILQELRYKINNKEAVAKLVWDVYFKRASDEMIKRVLGGAAPSGIYKITYLKTGQCYIGKSTDVSTRWRNHLKTSLGLQAIAHSTIHTEMEKKGIWNFSFELLEECPKDKLTEREKYYINLYDTKKFGYNMREG